jgi:hypothetical protein
VSGPVLFMPFPGPAGGALPSRGSPVEFVGPTPGGCTIGLPVSLSLQETVDVRKSTAGNENDTKWIRVFMMFGDEYAFAGPVPSGRSG